MSLIRSILLIVAGLFQFNFGRACTCMEPGITEAYFSATKVFYGKFISTDTSTNFYSALGRPYIVENFEVFKGYKGLNQGIIQNVRQANRNGKYIISLLSRRGDGCSVPFKNGSMYLVYAHACQNFGILTTDGCVRTREIIGNDFTTSLFSQVPGIDEELELVRLSSLDSLNAPKNLSEFGNNDKTMLSAIHILENRLRNRNIWILTLLVILGLGLVLFILRRIPQKK